MKKRLKRFNRIVYGLIILLIGLVPAFEHIAVQAEEVPYVTAIAAGNIHSLALTSDRTVVAWGDNSADQIAVPEDLSDVVAIAAGSNHSLALKSDGTVVGWGDTYYGQSNAPIGQYIAIAAGSNHSLALKSDGTVVGWGG